MAQEIIDQFDRNYAAPIETNRVVSTITNRNNIPLGVRHRGMLVHVLSENTTYELRSVTDNSGWEIFEGLPEAPEDGNIYGRKDGEWVLVTVGSSFQYWNGYRWYKTPANAFNYPIVGEELQGRGDGRFQSGEWVHGEVTSNNPTDDSDFNLFVSYP